MRVLHFKTVLLSTAAVLFLMIGSGPPANAAAHRPIAALTASPTNLLSSGGRVVVHLRTNYPARCSLSTAAKVLLVSTRCPRGTLTRSLRIPANTALTSRTIVVNALAQVGAIKVHLAVRIREKAKNASGISASSTVTPTTSMLPTTTTNAPNVTASSAPSGSTWVTSAGWEITVYVTAVETYYSGDATELTGCLSINCGYSNDSNDLGAYPASFVARVKDEGTGLITSGPHAGMYLNWSAGISDTGYWLDTAPRDSYGGALVPFVSAAADGLARRTQVRILGCGTNDDGTAVNASVCAKFQASNWLTQDQFTPGLGGANHIDLYLGDETGPNFEKISPFWITFEGASLSHP
jgi:hypothetical protein